MDEYISLSSGKTICSNPTSKDITASITNSHLAMLIEGKRYKVYDKDEKTVADFLNNKELNSAPIRYLNEKLLMYFSETEDGHIIGLANYNGKVLTDIKYSDITAVAGTTSVIATDYESGLSELVNEGGKILQIKMNNVTSWNGVDNEGRLIPPLVYWKENDDTTDVDKCIQLNEKMLEN